MFVWEQLSFVFVDITIWNAFCNLYDVMFVAMRLCILMLLCLYWFVFLWHCLCICVRAIGHCIYMLLCLYYACICMILCLYLCESNWALICSGSGWFVWVTACCWPTNKHAHHICPYIKTLFRWKWIAFVHRNFKVFLFWKQDGIPKKNSLWRCLAMHRRVLRPARAPKGLSCLTTDGSPALRKCTIIHIFRKIL